MKDLTEFKNYLTLNCGSEASVICHIDKLKNYFNKYDEFNQDNVNKFLIEKKELVAKTSFNMYLNALKWYTKFLKTELTFPSYKRIDVRVKDYLSPEEVEDIFNKLPMVFDNHFKVKIILTLMIESGCRPKEILQLKRCDFDFETKNIIIKNTKVHKDKLIPISNKLCDSLYTYFNQEGEQDNAFNLSSVKLKYIFRKIHSRLNLKKEFTPYSMRRSYAHNMIEQGVKLTTLQSSMNHANISTTLGYLKVSDEQANKEIRSILNRKKGK